MPWQADLPLFNGFSDFSGKTAKDETGRTIALDDRIVPYTLRRSRRRTIGLTIDHRGLRVGAPPRVSVTEIESFIRKHGHWVTQKLDECRKSRRSPVLTIDNGTRLPYLGGWLEIRLVYGGNHAFWKEAGETGENPQLTLCLRSPENTANVLEAALRRRALQLFGERLAFHAERFGLALPPLALSSARTRWGSCSRRSGIRLNWRLIHAPLELIDYVIVHELAHFQEMNHSARFWTIVGCYFPDYTKARDALKDFSSTLSSII